MIIILQQISAVIIYTLIKMIYGLFILTGEDIKQGGEMEILTLEKLKAMQPNTIFASGVIVDNEKGINMTRSGKLLKWVAVRGGIWDWAIYCHWADKSWRWIKDSGDKVRFGNHIKKLVPCDDEAFKMYRY